MSNLNTVLSEIASWYTMVMSVAGTIGNLLTCSLCCTKHLRKTPTFVFMAFMVIVEIFPLVLIGLNKLFRSYLGLGSLEKTLIGCKIETILTYIMSQSAAFLLVAIAVERYLSVKIKSWRNVYFNSMKATVISISIILFFFLLHIHLSVTMIPIQMTNTTIGDSCTVIPIRMIWATMHTYLFSMIPFAILLIFNILLIIEITKSAKVHVGIASARATARRRSLTISILILTFSFILLTGPSAIGSGYFQNIMESSQRLALSYLSCLSVTFHGYNFFLFMLSNKEFSKEFKRVTYRLFSIKNNLITDTNAGSTVKTRKVLNQN